MERDADPWEMSFYQRAIMTKIGQTLRVEYGQDDLTQPLPHGLFTLLMQLNEPQNEPQTKSQSEPENDGRDERSEQRKPAG